MNIVNNQAARLTYEIGLEMLRNAGLQAQEGVLSQSYLRCEMPINSSTTNYKVPMLFNDNTYGTPFNTEQRLNLQDAFIMSELFVGLAAPTGATDAAFEVLTFPDPVLFTTTTSRAAMVLYNGKVTGMVNNFNILPAWDIQRHFLRQRTQDGVGITAQTVFGLNSTDASTDGYYPVQPLIVQVGSKNIQWNVVLPAAVTSVLANSRIIFIQRGLLAQNCTPVK